jgi:hypothetical protein
MCFGSYFAAFYRGEDSKQIPEKVVAVLWPGIAPAPEGRPVDVKSPGHDC